MVDLGSMSIKYCRDPIKLLISALVTYRVLNLGRGPSLGSDSDLPVCSSTRNKLRQHSHGLEFY